jgi:hypothetical protein
VQSRNGDSNQALQDAVRLMRRAREVPASVREHLVREQRRRAVERIVEVMRRRKQP